MKWSNIPLPEGHLVGLILGGIIHVFIPHSPIRNGWITHLLAWPILTAGVVLVIWAVLTASRTVVTSPDVLLTDGPYSFSRNPMYVGWTGIYLGVSLVVNSTWIFAFFPPVFIYNHVFVIRKEERFLRSEFGEAYLAYRRRVRRYL